MNKLVTLTFVALGMFWLAACATPTTVPAAIPAKSATLKATLASTNVPAAPAETATPITRLPSPTTSPTIPAPTVAPTNTPAPTPVKPGLYVTDLRVDPNPPTRGAELNFYPMFLNTTGTVQNFKWIVYIFRADTPTKSFGETTSLLTAIPTSGGEFKSLGFWKLPLGGPCDYFFARVAWFDPNNQVINFTTPDGKVFEKGLTVCPPPAQAPSATPAAPTITPTPSPDVYVIDLRTDPDPPTRGSELNFYPTFANTTGNPLNYKWKVYIFKSDDPTKSYGETTTTDTTIPASINEQHSLGYWKLPLGGPCENYLVRVAWFDANNKITVFPNFDKKPFEHPLTVCPP